MTVHFLKRQHLPLVIIFLVGAFGTWAALPIDEAVSQNLRHWDLPGDVEKAINLSEVFAHGLGALGIFACLLTVCPGKTRALWGAIILTSVSGISANVAKGAVARIRPHSQEVIRLAGDEPPAVLPTQAGPNPDGSPKAKIVPASFWDARQRSFPSGHAATAWGLAIGLSLVFPRGTIVFVVFALLACLQRIVSGAHFLSDVTAGTSIAFLASLLLLRIPAIARLFDKLD